MPVLPCTSDPETMPAAMWGSLVNEAIDQSRCAGTGTDCRIAHVFHRAGWCIVSHVSVEPHQCLTCLPRATPEHLVSSWTLTHTERRILVRALALWMDHLHPDPASFVTGALDSATGADLGAAANSTNDA